MGTATLYLSLDLERISVGGSQMRFGQERPGVEFLLSYLLNEFGHIAESQCNLRCWVIEMIKKTLCCPQFPRKRVGKKKNTILEEEKIQYWEKCIIGRETPYSLRKLSLPIGASLLSEGLQWAHLSVLPIAPKNYYISICTPPTDCLPTALLW